jgi:putative SOS response-associated peptidase YedK
MCGRFMLADPGRALGEFSMIEKRPALTPRYNVAPSHAIAVVRIASPGAAATVDMLIWGFAPPPGSQRPASLINARAETAAQKRTFAAAFRDRRCLIVADGFYEWKRSQGGRQPFLVRRADGRPFAMAGLWEPSPSGADACTILTRPPVAVVASLHDRMPAMLDSSLFGAWLDPQNHDTEALRDLLLSPMAFELVTVPVGPRVNKPANDDPSLIDPVPEAPEAQLDLFAGKR